MFQFGAMLPKGPRGQVDAGLGKVTSRGTVTLIPPTQVITAPIETHVIDGVEIDVPARAGDRGAGRDAHVLSGPQRAEPGRERHAQPAQYLPDPRRPGARRQRLGEVSRTRRATSSRAEADVVFAQHHWPVWGNARVLDYLAKQRDTYKYLHDQTLRLMNHGYKAAEIAERAGAADEPRARVARARLLRHAQPQRQGRLSALPRLVRRQPGQPQSAAARWSARRKYVDYMGGAEAAIAQGARGLRAGASTAGSPTP